MIFGIVISGTRPETDFSSFLGTKSTEWFWASHSQPKRKTMAWHFFLKAAICPIKIDLKAPKQQQPQSKDNNKKETSELTSNVKKSATEEILSHSPLDTTQMVTG